eukprot:296991_1
MSTSWLSKWNQTFAENKQNNCNSVEKCSHINRILFVLEYYDSWCKEIGKIDINLYEIINNKLENYGNKHLINDFNHILKTHQTDDEFEFIDKTINQNNHCKIKQCNKLKRNERDRSKQTNDLYFNIQDVKQIHLLQCFDKIHVALCHAFDLYRARKIEKSNVNYDVEDSKYDYNELCSKTLIDTKRENISHFRGANQLNLNKFCSHTQTLNTMDDIKEEKKQEHYANIVQFEESVGKTQSLIYSYGINFWDYGCKEFKDYFDEGQHGWFVIPKYENMKEE